MLGISKRASIISPSQTLAITSLAKSMIQQGKNVVSFGAGEPDFDTFQPIKDAAKKAIDEGYTKYTPEGGSIELRQAICEKLRKENGLTYSVKQIVASNGAKHSLYNVFQAILNPKDEVIIISPFWLSYPEMVRLADGMPVFVNAKEAQGFKVSVKALKKAITKKTKAIVLNSPSNPAGIIYDKSEIQEIADLAVSAGLYVVSDEIYEKLIYDGAKHISIASLGDKIYDQTVTVNGVSKAYSMTGWRIGYIAAKEELAKAISNVQSHSTSNPCSISQKATIAALKMDDREIEIMRKVFEKRRDYMLGLLDGIRKIAYTKPGGAFYVYCNISKTGMKANEFARKILEEKLVAVIPCEAFGSDKHIRLSFATSEDKIKEGLDRIKSWVKQ